HAGARCLGSRVQLQEIGPPRESDHREHPFWRFQRDRVWTVDAPSPPPACGILTGQIRYKEKGATTRAQAAPVLGESKGGPIVNAFERVPGVDVDVELQRKVHEALKRAREPLTVRELALRVPKVELRALQVAVNRLLRRGSIERKYVKRKTTSG